MLTGDLVNHIDGLRLNLPKPRLYSLLLIPESTSRLDTVRRYLATLERDHDARLRVSLDRLALEQMLPR